MRPHSRPLPSALLLLTLAACSEGLEPPAAAPEGPVTQSVGTPSGAPARAEVKQPSGAPSQPGRWHPVDVASLPTGADPGAAGVFPGRPEERPRGPQAFTVTADQHLVIVDNEKGRLLRIDPEGRLERTIPLGEAGYLTALEALEGGRLAGYDARGEALVVLEADGRVLERAPLTAALQPYSGLSASGPRLLLRAGDELVRLEPDAVGHLELEKTPPARFRGWPLPDGDLARTRKTGRSTGELEISREATDERRAVQVTAPTGGLLGSITLMGADARGRLFVRLETLESQRPIRVRRFIRIFDLSLAEVDTFEYPLEGVVVAEDDVHVDAAGRVYVLLPYRDRVEVKRYAP